MVLLAWTPFYLLWGLLNALDFGLPLPRAFLAAASSIGSAAFLGGGVWWLSGRIAWPDRVAFPFYGIHLLLAAAYSALWIGNGVTLLALRHHAGWFDTLRESPYVGWRFVTGIWLYGLVAGVSYAVRIRRKLRRRHEASLRAEALASEARLEGLRAQLRPHFLFNSLHSLSCLLDVDPAQARAALERLGNLLRYTLEDGRGVVSLEREWAFTRDYLAMEKIRFEERLTVNARFDRGTLARPVPSFCLQTLVENAILHGPCRLLEGGTVGITASMEGEDLLLAVEDDGPGTDPGSLHGGEGRGIRTLRERLRAWHPERASLVVITAPGRGFRVELRVPRPDPVGNGKAAAEGGAGGAA